MAAPSCKFGMRVYFGISSKNSIARKQIIGNLLKKICGIKIYCVFVINDLDDVENQKEMIENVVENLSGNIRACSLAY